MNERQSLIGFTEAELGFFLVLLGIVLWVTTAGASPPVTPPVGVQIAPESLAALQAARARLVAAERQRDSLRRVVDSLRSPIWPSCRSRGLARGSLGTIIALGANRYRWDTDTITVAQLGARTQSARAAAEQAQCRHEVVLGFRRDLSAPEYEASRRGVQGLSLRLLTGPEVDR
jgi:hypothetical protein